MSVSREFVQNILIQFMLLKLEHIVIQLMKQKPIQNTVLLHTAVVHTVLLTVQNKLVVTRQRENAFLVFVGIPIVTPAVLPLTVLEEFNMAAVLIDMSAVLTLLQYPL